MGEDRKYYDVEDYKRWKKAQGKANKVAPRPNLLAAASWLRKFFDARKTNFAVMGSLAMLCLGARREIPDIHIVYDDKDFQRIRMKLQTDSRVRLPKDMNSMFPTKLLISTGPKYGDVGCTEKADIEVEMVPPGSHGTPPSDILRSHQAMLSLNLDGKTTNIKGLNIIYLVKSTVHLCNSDDLLWDPKKDLLWLCRKYGKEIQSIRGQLNARQVQENFLGTPFFSTLSVDEQRLCYNVLLGKEPPPSMFLTPAPVPGQPTSTTIRPSFPAHKSAPVLKDVAQQPSTFLRPPMHGKSKTAPGAPSNGSVAPTSHAAPKPPKKDTTTDAARDSRSRYRNTSAPTTPNASRNPSPGAGTARQTAEVRSDHPQQHSRIYQAQSINMQKLAPASKPQVVRTKKSLTRMDGQIASQVIPMFAHKPSTASTAPKDKVQITSAIPSKHPEPKASPSESALKAQANGGATSSAPYTPPQVVAHTHPAHLLVAQRNSMMPPANNTATSVSSKPTTDGTKTETSSKGLSVVGPEGLYPTPLNIAARPAKSQPAAPVVQPQSQHMSPGFVFELDASSPQVESFAQAAPATNFVAELPANVEASLQPSQPVMQRSNSIPETPVSPPQVPAHLVSSYADSPVSPPTTYRPLSSIILPLNPTPNVQAAPIEHRKEAPKPVTKHPSMGSLPPSLMIGFRGAQSPQSNTSGPSSHVRASSQSSNGSNPASQIKYQRYHSPPNSREASPNNGSISAPNSRQPSPGRGPVYKAYTPPITPPMRPKTESAQSQQHPSVHSQAALPPSVATAPAFAPAPAPVQSAPVPMERASEFVGRASPPNILKARAPKPLKFATAARLPNPLAANPPTPRTTSHVKHDSHQGSPNDTEVRGVAPVSVPTAIPLQQQVVQSPPEFRVGAEPYGGQQPPPQTQPQYVAFNAQNVPATHPQPHRQSSLHQRTVSTESNTSTTSHDSLKMAQEYQLDLPSYDDGYGAHIEDTDADTELKKSYRPSYAGTGYGENTQFKLDLKGVGKRESKQGAFIDEYDFT